MTCPHCRSRQTRKLNLATDLGYARYQCRSCRRTFHERTGTPFNFLEMPTDIVFQAVLFRLPFKLSLRDLMHLFLIRGYDLSYETVRDWETRMSVKWRAVRGQKSVYCEPHFACTTARIVNTS